MPSESGGNITMDPLQVSLASLVDAANTLAKAAAALAVAAQATIEVLSEEAPRPETPEESYGINLGRGSDVGSDKMINERDQNQQPGGEEQPVSGAVTGELDYTRSEYNSTPRHTEYAEDQTEWQTLNTDMPEYPRSSYKNNPPYRLLIDSEADVLLFVCAIIDERQKIICYVPGGNVPLKVYKHLFESVIESPVHMLLSNSKRDPGYTDFLQSHESVLLVPETLSPELELEENSWVIHIGWPASEERYTTQRMNHRTHNNLLVACTWDQSLYSSCESIMKQTKPWPQDGAPFRASVSILRPLYEVALSEISRELKAQVYRDWVQLHGIHGSRRVEAWSPSMVVQHANDYLMQVWQWNGEHNEGDDIPLPQVSRGFVTQNGLQLAVLEGLLRVEGDDLDFTPSIPSPAGVALDVPPINEDHLGPDSASTPTEFQPITGNTYFTLQEEFDALPLICFLCGKYEKVILFVEGQGALRLYKRLLGKISARLKTIPTTSNDSQAIEDALELFLSFAPPTILLLPHNINNPPPALSQASIDCCIYWTFNSPLRAVKQNQPLINCETTIIIDMPSRQRRRPFPKDFSKHRSAAITQDLTENSALAPMRSKMKSVLTSSKSLVKSLYASRVYALGAVPRQSLSAEEVARRANQYAARVLLHGEREDGSETFPPVAGRPLVPRVTVEKFDLQPAVDAGLLTIG
ncbi:hypothetical protein V565_058050 [Rhizoctonia solani 123E]|uniref:Uncharacterized protein n=1 Tax=Rhizoctonia solani 123E TaxID=1423351 RepID=A0A074S429_9AGAM|nr:hypothetical protein V565_058050 [Rhizoctonia solani 123E]